MLCRIRRWRRQPVGSGGVRIRLQFLSEDVDRYGNVRRYVRVPGRKKIRLREHPSSEAFMAEYHAAVGDEEMGPRQRSAIKRGSFRHLCIRYFASNTGAFCFARLDQSTKNWQRRSLEEICLKDGDKPVALMQPRHVKALRDEKKDLPGAAKNRLKSLRALFRWAVEENEAPHDPTNGVKPIPYQSDGFHTWTVEEVEQYEKRHKRGTKARLGFDLLFYTTCRREDVVRFGPQHVRKGRIQFRQAKNEHRNPVDIDIPLHSNLAASIKALRPKNLTFLVTAFGKPFSPNGFGNKFKDWCRQADLPHCSAHGLRKAQASRLAERGATPHEIMAITGHKTLEEVERYTRKAKTKGLADRAMARLKRS